MLAAAERPNGIGGYGHDASYYGGNSCDGGGNEKAWGSNGGKGTNWEESTFDLRLEGECTGIGEEGEGIDGNGKWEG